MSIFGRLFGSGASHAVGPNGTMVAPATTSVNPTANPTVPSSATAQSDGSVAAIPAAGTGETSPLANYPDLFKTDPNTPPPLPTSIKLSPDNKQLMDIAKTIDFTKDLDPAKFALAQKGDTAALLSMMNDMGQQGYARAAAASAAITEKAMADQMKIVMDRLLPEALRRNNISTAVQSENPIFNDPAAAPMVTMLQTQFTQKYPTASPAEIKEHVGNYLTGFANLVARANGQSLTAVPVASKNGSGDEDWDKYFGLTA